MRGSRPQMLAARRLRAVHDGRARVFLASLPFWALAPLLSGCVPDSHPAGSGGSTTTSTGGSATGTGGAGGTTLTTGGGGGAGGAGGSTGGGGAGTGGAIGGTGGAAGGGPCGPVAGDEIWSLGFPGGGSDRARYVAVDGSGNVIVAGDFMSDIDLGDGPVATKGSLDAFVTKRAPDGHPLWNRIFGDGSEQYVQGAAVDGSGNVAVSGAFYGTLDFGAAGSMTASFVDGWVVKLNAAGEPQWARQIQTAGADEASGVAFDPQGNLYVVGEIDGTTNLGGGDLVSAGSYDAFIVKYDPDGVHLWSKRFGDAALQHAYHVAADATGVVLTGFAYGAIDFGAGPISSAGGEDVLVAKFDPGGDLQWGKLVGDAGAIQRGQRVAVDGAGNTYLVGWFDGTLDFGGGPLVSSGARDGFLVKLDSAGDHVWSRHYGTGTPTEESAYGVAVASSGEIAVSGAFNAPLDFGGGLLTPNGPDVFVVLYDATGAHLWSRRAGDGQEQVSSAVAFSPSSEVVLGGHYLGSMDWGDGMSITSAGSADAWVAKLHGCP